MAEKCELLLHSFGYDYDQKDIKTVDSLIYPMLITPVFKRQSHTLDEALNSGSISLIESDSLRDLLYKIPSFHNEIIINENYINDDFKNNALPYLYIHTSLRQIDESLSQHGDDLGKSKLKYIDNRAVLADVKFENMVDNKIYDLKSLTRHYRTFDQLNSQTISLLKREISRMGNN
jgi:hypothetical protein